VVVDVAKLSVGREDYYVREVAQNREEYLTGHGESPGRWLGQGAATLDQQGTASTEAFVRMFHGRHPDTGALLGRAHGEGGVPAFDVVFRPTKSVSLLYGLGDAQVASVVLEAHHEATTEALGYLEAHVGARRGHGGCEHVAGDGLVAVGFDHRTSRAGDPLLHTHVIVANRVQGPDGRWTALDGRDLYRHRLAADAIYRGTYQRALSRSLGVEWTGPDQYGNREVAGIPDELVRAFSKRADAIDLEVERLESEGRVRTPKLVKWVVHSTRQAKRQEAPATLAERWRAEAREHGADVPGLLRDVLGRPADDEPTAGSETEVAAAFDQLAGAQGLTAQASTFARQDVIAALGAQLACPDRTRLETLADRFLEEQAVSVMAERSVGERRYATPELLGVEQRLVAGALGRQGDRAGVCSPEAVRAALAEHPTIGEDQAGMVRDLCRQGAGVGVVVGKAGTGKTYALGVARHAFALDGHRAMGTAPTGIATTSLEAEGFEEVATVDRLLVELDQAARSGQRSARGGQAAAEPVLDARTVLVVDEAGMVGSRKLTRLLDHAHQAGAKVVLVGDDRQLGSIDAGGGFRGLRLRLGASVLTENRRQHQAWERDALELVRDGQVDQAVAAYREHDRVVAARSKTELTLQLVRDWWTARQEAEAAESAGEPGKDAVILAYRRDEVDRLNTVCQQVMAENSRLGAERFQIGDRTFHVGDQVVCGRNDLQGLGVANGTRGTITALDLAQRAITIRTEQGRKITLDTDYLDRPTPKGRRVVDLAYATTGHKAQGLTRWRALVRLTGQEDANWLYVQLSRAKHLTRLFTIVGPEPQQTVGEIDLPEREPTDAYDQLATALARPGSQTLAIDASSRLDVRAVPTTELRGERDQLRQVMDQAPPDRSRMLKRATERRQHAEQTLAEIERAQPPSSKRRRAGRDVPGDTRTAHALATQQAARALDAELQARKAQQQHDAWIEAHPDLEIACRDVAAELAWRRRARATVAEVEQPAHLAHALGPIPDSVRGRRSWRHAARLIEDYRDRYQVADPDQPLGATQPRDPEQRQAWRAAHDALERVQARQRQLPGDRQRNVTTPAHDHDQPIHQHARDRDHPPVQGPERAAG
jgi:conjugative relaxase-like TrwC/TraI family protein